MKSKKVKPKHKRQKSKPRSKSHSRSRSKSHSRSRSKSGHKLSPKKKANSYGKLRGNSHKVKSNTLKNFPVVVGSPKKSKPKKIKPNMSSSQNSSKFSPYIVSDLC